MSKNLPEINKGTISIIGLGYVGLPLAIEFSKTNLSINKKLNKSRKVIGFDINKKRINELKNFHDKTNESSYEELKSLKNINFTCDEKELENAEIFIITVPTPIDKNKRPDLNPIKNAIEMISNVLNKSKLKEKTIFPIIIESTVYPGVTEEICIPMIKKLTGLNLNEDFIFGYSPERINPGDNAHKLNSIIKVTSGSNDKAAEWIDNLYKTIVAAGTFKAKNIKTAEAAKVIENIQRDLNIALINELSIIFNRLDIDTLEVLKCSETKWNFLPFKPGLVGGHCIGVDPYYLTFKSEEMGYSPQVILAGRRINDNMPDWIIQQVIKQIAHSDLKIKDLEILILGFTFKENCPDYRNTKVLDLVNSIKSYGAKPVIYDPKINTEELKYNLGIELEKNILDKKFKVIICAVAHKEFSSMNINQWQDLMADNCLLFDLKGIVPKKLNPKRF